MYVRNITVEANRHKRKSAASRKELSGRPPLIYPSFDAYGRPIPQNLRKHLIIADLPEEQFEQVLIQNHRSAARYAPSQWCGSNDEDAPLKPGPSAPTRQNRSRQERRVA